MSGNPSQAGFQAALSQVMAQRALAGSPTPEVFANQVRMAISPTDFTLVFGTSISDSGRGAESAALGLAVSLDKVILHVAPGMLKQLLLQIEMAVEAYESVMGNIKVPQSMPAHLSRHKTLLTNMLHQIMEADLQPETDPNTP